MPSFFFFEHFMYLVSRTSLSLCFLPVSVAPQSLSPLVDPPSFPALICWCVLRLTLHTSSLYFYSLSQGFGIYYFLCLESSPRYPQALLLHSKSQFRGLSVAPSLTILYKLHFISNTTYSTLPSFNFLHSTYPNPTYLLLLMYLFVVQLFHKI